jgi:hypothetical protein
LIILHSKLNCTRAAEELSAIPSANAAQSRDEIELVRQALVAHARARSEPRTRAWHRACRVLMIGGDAPKDSHSQQCKHRVATLDLLTSISNLARFEGKLELPVAPAPP